MQSSLIIIPCYNESKRLPISQYESFFNSKKGSQLDFLFVNDGSSDNTIEVLRTLEQKYTNVKVLDLDKNVGKAEAIRQGMLRSVDLDYPYLGYFDADLATPLEEINRLLEMTKKTPEPFLVMGSRVKLLGYSDIQRKLSRHYIGRVFATVVSNMLKLSVYDTQCGAKLIQRKVAFSLFEEPFLSKWLFDVELLFRLKKYDKNFDTRVVEVPIQKWEDVAGSKISTSYFLKAPLDLLRIYFSYNK
ncbi:MAG: glycosyltransferase family 2 protein [Flavobacteriales bacterium]|nr:glycosyltransferase family 2 protein [Flavobacteriales bacterium]